MTKVGLTEEQINAILSEEMAYWRITSEESLKQVIAKAIIANNEKVADDVKRIVANVLQTV